MNVNHCANGNEGEKMAGGKVKISDQTFITTLLLFSEIIILRNYLF